MKFDVKHILFFYLFTLLAGALFFIPAIFVNRFATAPALWIQAGISMGIMGYVLLTKNRITLPPKSFILLITIWATYHLWQSGGNIENMTTIVTLVATFFLFHAIWKHLRDKKLLFAVFSLLAVILSLWGLGQFSGLLKPYHGSFNVTGPFDNPAGISAALVVLLPFVLYTFLWTGKRHRALSAAAVCLVAGVIILSRARAAILAMVVMIIFFFFRMMRERDLKIRPVHHLFLFAGFLLLFTGMFFMKRDSASGRLLMWRCSVQLVADRPFLGHGARGFTANYMNEQASYFMKHPSSKYAMLADNVRHPFNEFLKWAVNHGLVGLCLTSLLIIVPLWGSREDRSTELFAIRLGLLAAGVCAFFSYPFNYPFIRLMTVALLAFALAANPRKGITALNGYFSKGIALLFSLGLLFSTTRQAYHEREWHKIAHRSLRGETDRMLPRYESIYTYLNGNDLFLYNYAAELNVAGQYKISMKIARECDNLWADYDLQMLMADNCRQLQQHDETEGYLKKAAAMCPVKFMPLYQLTGLYLETGQEEEARALAQKIMDKQVKIPSPIINSIKNKMRNLLNEPKKHYDKS
ncbi:MULTISPECIES: O-antigen ligase family protein [unclassified Proteiniphilum]|mgnify:CR=1 FL=1|jgi:O-antigen ligase|uniref:O-antigen ligase family protein n=1 Tax=unclassified Proteiniphilum TaxID=2622718 RepID=UPI00257EE2C5|nr:MULTISPECIES: O-antigen ligase family protein [unclassified Proteiniphilum]